ncbi:MAG: pilus assembly protein [Anaerolineae bacterium]|nr:pilus assembly protein [Anaerolineae bacterium]
MSNQEDRKNSGQSILEFAVTVIFLFIAVYGVLVLGQVFHVKVVLNNAAREGVRYLSLHPMENTEGFSGTKAAAVAEAQNSGVIINISDVTVPMCNIDEVTGFCESGFPVEVHVETSFSLAWEWIFPNSVEIESVAKMMVP